MSSEKFLRKRDKNPHNASIGPRSGGFAIIFLLILGVHPLSTPLRGFDDVT